MLNLVTTLKFVCRRTLEISGPLQNVHVAHALVLKRVAELELQFAYPPVGAMGMDPQGYNHHNQIMNTNTFQFVHGNVPNHYITHQNSF